MLISATSIQPFTEFSQSLGLLNTEETFTRTNFEDSLDQQELLQNVLFIHLLKLNRESLMELSKRVVNFWLDGIKQIEKENIVSPIKQRKKANNSFQSNTSSQNSKFRTSSVRQSNPRFKSFPNPLNKISSRRKSASDSGNHYEQLYKNSFKKQENQIIKQSLRQQQELDQCTFKPKLNVIENSSKQYISGKVNTPVYDRLSQQAIDKRQRHHISEQIKEKTDTMECSFKPQINHALELSQSEDRSCAFERLYKDAEIKRLKMHTLHMQKDLLDANKFTHSPYVLPPSEDLKFGYLSVPVEERLYNRSLSQAQNKFEQQLYRNEREVKECTFSPKINSMVEIEVDDRQQVHERLYNLSILKEQQQLNKLLKFQNEEDQINQSPLMNYKSLQIVSLLQSKLASPKSTNSDIYTNKFSEGNTYYDRLYKENESQEKRKKVREVQQLKDSGCTFKPKLNNSSLLHKKLSVPKRLGRQSNKTINSEIIIPQQARLSDTKNLFSPKSQKTYNPKQEIQDIMSVVFQRKSILNKQGQSGNNK